MLVMQNTLSFPLPIRPIPFRSGAFRRSFATLLALFALIGVAAAGTVQASISGDSVTYSAQGLPPNAPVTVQIKNMTTASATSQGPFDTGPGGRLPPSTGTTGDSIAPGTTVQVTVMDAQGNTLGQASVTKPQERRGFARLALWILRRLFGA